MSWPLTLLENKVTFVPTTSAKAISIAAEITIDLWCQSEGSRSAVILMIILVKSQKPTACPAGCLTKSEVYLTSANHVKEVVFRDF